MNYIGSKLSLLNFLNGTIEKTLSDDGFEIKDRAAIFADLFAGTGIVGSVFKEKDYDIISNDIQYYSYVLNKHYIENTDLDIIKMTALLEKLNDLKGVCGFIYENYSLDGSRGKEYERNYFTEFNAKKCDAIRLEIERLKNADEITRSAYFYLLTCLLNAVDKVANTASVYGAFLKNVKKSAMQPLKLTPLKIISGKGQYIVYNKEINELITEISGDVLYLDPPYNSRQYCTNYHLLETVAKYDNPAIYGKTGLREYSKQKSEFCSNRTVEQAFDFLIKNARFKYIFLSYNNEGLMTLETVARIMKKYGRYSVSTQQYKRFKADNARNNKAKSTLEYLHCLIKER